MTMQPNYSRQRVPLASLTGDLVTRQTLPMPPSMSGTRHPAVMKTGEVEVLRRRSWPQLWITPRTQQWRDGIFRTDPWALLPWIQRGRRAVPPLVDGQRTNTAG